MSLPGEGVREKPEVYREKPVLFVEGDSSAVLYGMVEYRAGNGRPPITGDEMVVSITGPTSYTYDLTPDEQGETSYARIEQRGRVILEGGFRVDEVYEGTLPGCPFVKPTGNPDFWGVKVTRVHDGVGDADIDRLESAGLVSMI